MTQISQSIELIKSVCGEVNTLQMAKMAGVKYSTLRGWVRQDFSPDSVEFLKKLEAAAVAYKRQPAEHLT